MNKVQKGFTIIEIMIALTLSLILVAGLTQIFVANSRTFNVGEASARTQETGRLALSIMSREIRNADYWGCQGSEGVMAGSIVNMLNPAAGVDVILRGVDGENDTGPGGSDVLFLAGTDPNSALKVVKQPSGNAANLHLSAVTGIKENDIVLVSNCQRGHMFQVTNEPDKQNNGQKVVVHNTGNVSSGPGNAFKEIQPSYNDDPNGAFLFKPYKRSYYLQENGATGRRELVRDGVALLGTAGSVALFEDVRNFQFQFGRDTNGNGQVNVWSDPGDPDHADEAIAIRVSLLIRSPDDRVTDGAQSYCYPGWLDCANDASLLTTAGASDTFLYRVYTTTSTMRNRI
ncbi:MAG: prepilin-type N-terminal cleavage/methylation domain-containing protein [Oceanospirillales bacterium]|nr:prepilin-type N-terminal cleavage/methylation domain-containing protein [Oceanospirillales bacterium]